MNTSEVIQTLKIYGFWNLHYIQEAEDWIGILEYSRHFPACPLSTSSIGQNNHFCLANDTLLSSTSINAYLCSISTGVSWLWLWPWKWSISEKTFNQDFIIHTITFLLLVKGIITWLKKKIMTLGLQKRPCCNCNLLRWYMYDENKI